MRLAAFLVAALPVAAQAEWSFTDTYTIASAPSEGGMRLVIDCSPTDGGGGPVQFRLDGFAERGELHTGATAFLTGPRIEDVYAAECTGGSCILAPAPNLPEDVRAGQMPALVQAWRTGEVFDVTVYRGGPVGAFDMTGSAAAMAELEASGCELP